ncbi:MAG: hypothetical protein FWH56_02810 [Betaproteobacteria bacterium]|nr:hypothetical protein [Betaproteobacteria bacterium]
MSYLFADDIRKFLTIMGIFFAFTLLTACSPQKSAAEDYINAIANNRIEEAIGYFALKNENNSMTEKKKLMVHIDRLHAIIHDNGGLNSLSTTIEENKTFGMTHVNAEMKYKNGTTRTIQLALLKEQGGWKIDPFQTLINDAIEDYILAVVDKRDEDAIKHFSLVDEKNLEKEKLLTHIDRLHTLILENGGLVSFSTTIENSGYKPPRVDVEMKYKNGTKRATQLALVDEQGEWKIDSSKTLARDVIESYIVAVMDKHVDDAIKHFSLADAENLTATKEKLLARIDHLHLTIQENGGFRSLSATFDDKKDGIITASVEINFMNNGTGKTHLSLVDESGEWKINSSPLPEEKIAEDYIRAIADNRIDDAAQYFSAEKAKRGMRKGRITESLLPEEVRGMSSTRGVIAEIFEEANKASLLIAIAKFSAENLASSIQENGGLDSVLASTVDYSYDSTHENNRYNVTKMANVVVYMRYKNGKRGEEKLTLLEGWKKWEIDITDLVY